MASPCALDPLPAVYGRGLGLRARPSPGVLRAWLRPVHKPPGRAVGVASTCTRPAPGGLWAWPRPKRSAHPWRPVGVAAFRASAPPASASGRGLPEGARGLAARKA